jgi:hypothetical protein
MTELIWEGKYCRGGNQVALLRVRLPFQIVETVNESAQQCPDNGDKICLPDICSLATVKLFSSLKNTTRSRVLSRVGRLVTRLSVASVDCLSPILVTIANTDLPGKADGCQGKST